MIFTIFPILLRELRSFFSECELFEIPKTQKNLVHVQLLNILCPVARIQEKKILIGNLIKIVFLEIKIELFSAGHHSC